MKHDISERWQERLNSGECKQGKGRLCIVKGEEKEYCCLGVLCELYAEENEIIKNTVNDWRGQNCVTYGTQANITFLPDEVKEWAGMKSNVGCYQQGYHTLYEANDNGKTFPEIAEIIKKYEDEL